MKWKLVPMGDKLVRVGFPDISEIKCYVPDKPIKSLFTLRPLSEIVTIYQYQQYELDRH
jgi:hypothetical protein